MFTAHSGRWFVTMHCIVERVDLIISKTDKHSLAVRSLMFFLIQDMLP